MYDKSMNSLLRPRCVPVTGEERTGGGQDTFWRGDLERRTFTIRVCKAHLESTTRRSYSFLNDIGRDCAIQ